MTMKVKAIEKKLKFTKDPNDAGVYRYVMSPEQYSSLNQKKVIKEAALRSDDDAEVEDNEIGGSSNNDNIDNGDNKGTQNGGSQN